MKEKRKPKKFYERTRIVPGKFQSRSKKIEREQKVFQVKLDFLICIYILINVINIKYNIKI